MRCKLLLTTAVVALALTACSTQMEGELTPNNAETTPVSVPPTQEAAPAADAATATDEPPAVQDGDVITTAELETVGELPDELEAFQIPVTGDYLIKSARGFFAGDGRSAPDWIRAVFEPAWGDESAMRETALAVQAHDGSVAYWIVDLGDNRYTADSLSEEFMHCLENFSPHGPVMDDFIFTITYDCAEWAEENGATDLFAAHDPLL